MPDKPLPHLGQMLLTVAQVFFDEAIEGGHNSIDAGTCDELLAVLSSCQRDLVRSESCPLLQPHQEEAVVTAAKAGIQQRRALFMDAHVALHAVSPVAVKDGSSSSAKLVAVFYLVAGAFRGHRASGHNTVQGEWVLGTIIGDYVGATIRIHSPIPWNASSHSCLELFTPDQMLSWRVTA